jgi:putative membrane protein insertion efficiency factor
MLRFPYLRILTAILVGSLLALDLSRPAGRQFTARALVSGIHLYQHTLSHAMPALGITCRFKPSCSQYAEVVIARHGAAAGAWQTVRRIARCGPWTPMGTVDEPK